MRWINTKSRVAGILALYIMISFMMYIGYMTTHIEHQCTYINCQVCEHIEICKEQITQLGQSLMGASWKVLLVIGILFGSIYIKRVNSVPITLVGLKVRLDN